MRILRHLMLTAALPAAISAQAVNTDANGLALKGYDPVAYFTMGHAMLGTADLTAQYEGATYRFATAANRDTFMKEAVKYVPQYGGYCAFGVASGYKVKIDPEAFTIREGKLFLNYDKRVQARWSADIPSFLSKSEANWPDLKDKPRKDKVGS